MTKTSISNERYLSFKWKLFTLNAGKIVELSGLERKIVDKTMKELKAEGGIVSPKRCFWEPTK